MPTLPSGITMGIAMKAILPPGTTWFPCPKGHFWYEEPTRTVSSPLSHIDPQATCA